jgi:transcriptional antiterminator NusG
MDPNEHTKPDAKNGATSVSDSSGADSTKPDDASAQHSAEGDAQDRSEQVAGGENAGEAEGGAGEAPADMETEGGEASVPAEHDPKKWYIIHTYSGFENKVKASLRQRADAYGMGEKIGEILVPTEEVVEVRDGKKYHTKKKVFPGYVLVNMEMSDEAWHVVRSTPKVTGFLGGGQRPLPMSQDEVDRILNQVSVPQEKPKPKIDFKLGETVRITEGPFSNFMGTVEEVNEDRESLKVMVEIFGRRTPVELEYHQVQRPE